ncbi:hypothetical protein F5Y05DRAFT_365919 [Hypoxylon sp. FL0543]|nr:hypothetical protein F5Y05DRAFT_365919 [Hypoxylon sp. FL0543]
MQALRTRAACAARRPRQTALRTKRFYASERLGQDSHDHDSHDHDGHDHHHAPQVEEGLGTAFYIFAAAVPVSYVAYSASRPGPDGEPSSVSKWLRSFDYFNDWELRNTLRTNIIEQAAHDKHLLLNAGKNPHVDLKMPELINAGSPWNVPAGHYPKLDYLTEHYRKQAAEEEERKVKKLLAKAKEEEERQQQQQSSEA